MSDITRVWNLATGPQRKAIMFGGLAVGGYAIKSKLAMAIGIGGVITALVESWADSQLEKHPGEMNGFFQTDGKLSAVRGSADAIALRNLRSRGS